MEYKGKETSNKSKLNWLEKIHYGFTLLIVLIFPFFAMITEAAKKEYDIVLFFFTGIVFYFLHRYRDKLHFPYKELFYGFFMWVFFVLLVVILMVRPFYYTFIVVDNKVVFSEVRFFVAAMLTTFLVIVSTRFPDLIRLYTKGVRVKGTITKIYVMAFSCTHFTELCFHFSFCDTDNNTHLVDKYFVYAPRLEKWNVGDAIDIIYDPKVPERWAWINQ